MLCAGIENTILLGIRITEENAIQRRRNNGGKMPYKGAGKMPYFRLGIQKMPYYRPEEFGKNAML